MGLRDQLLKAGLISKKQAQKSENSAKKQQHDVFKKQTVAEQIASEKLALDKQIEAEKQQKFETDRQRNLEIEAQRREKEMFYRCKQLLKSNRLNEPRAQIPYYFVDDIKFVKKVMVTAYQREALARGKLGICKLADEDSHVYIIVPRYTASKVQTMCPAQVILLHSEIADSMQLSDVIIE